MAEIYILSGPVQSGKTTGLAKWMKDKKDVYGILSPVKNGKRYFEDVHTREIFKMETDREEPNTLSVGRFVFSGDSFTRATEILREALKQESGWIVLDEIGPLEINGDGFHDVVLEMLNTKNDSLKFVFVIRESLKEKALTFFQIKEYKPFNPALPA